MNGRYLRILRRRLTIVPAFACGRRTPIGCYLSNSALNIMDIDEVHHISSDELAGRFLQILRGFRDPSMLGKGRQVHAQVFTNGLDVDNLLESYFLGMYVLCGSICDAQTLFFYMKKESTLPWNWMIRGFSMRYLFEFSLLFYFKMLCFGILPDKYTFPYVIKSCCGLSAWALGSDVHRRICLMGLEKDIFVGSSLINMYAENGHVAMARKVFDQMLERDLVIWNVMIDGYVRVGDSRNAIEVFKRMRRSEIIPNYVTFSCILSMCAAEAIFCCGIQIHGLVIKHGLELEISVANTLLSMYSKCRCLNDVNRLFNILPNADVVTWNGIISGCVQNGLKNEAIELFYKMQDAGIKPDSITFSSFLPSFLDSTNLNQGKEIYAYIIRNNVCMDVFLKCALIDLYFKCKCVEMAKKIFNSTGTVDVVICSAMISGYVLNGLSEEALLMFRSLMKNEIKPNAVTLASVLPACASLTALTTGKELHGYILKNAFDEKCYVASSLVDMYAKCGRLELGYRIFANISKKDTVAWNSIIANSNQNGKPEETFNLFRQMRADGMNYDAVTISAALSACASLAALNYGKEIHGFMIRGALNSDLFAESALIDMYAKCGKLNMACQVFYSMIHTNEVSWNSIIAAFGTHGLLNEAVSMFQEMEKVGYRPDHITFLNLISACGHTGQIELGFKFFSLMGEYGIVARMEHYACMVDMYARAGKLCEAFHFISSMPLKADAGIWGALLGACRVHRNAELGQLAAEQLFELDPQNSGYYVLMSNIHAITGQWGGVLKVRSMMKKRKVQKVPGYSWIENNTTNHMFVSGDKTHPEYEHISYLLKVLLFELKEAGYVPNPDFVYQLYA
ncbi:hypothetical protein HPP92_010411 [Vanilla planifolia]|uniref:Pentatricopeptide repeat-containing protein n=1 Tax=Vanilla planifolia TaxID=51239 RepID=A0A835R424_VANPL|nr:hypothetical protein HPP92_010411 [Vanilla planifolia]